MYALLKSYLIALPIFLAFDAVWLGVIAKRFYFGQMKDIARVAGESFAPLWGSAALVYVAIPLGIAMFVLPLAKGDWLHALGYGVSYGAILYGTYDLTNLALLKGWGVTLTLVDIGWGMCICGMTSMIAARVLSALS